MDHIELTPYAFPEGMEIPRLMPEQDKAFNGDGYLAAEVLRLKETHQLRNAVETGTCLGSTTIWLARTFGFTTSTEINEDYKNIAIERLKAHAPEDTWAVVHGTPQNLLAEVRDYTGYDTLCFLDAHPMTGQGEDGYATVLLELRAIAEGATKPCIVIHDMLVPRLPQAGWDSYNGHPFTLEWITPALDEIYGEGGWKHNYPTKVEGANRGWISVEPVQD